MAKSKDADVTPGVTIVQLRKQRRTAPLVRSIKMQPKPFSEKGLKGGGGSHW
jgi:hypothetical protein